jgi:hypothetical protein
MSSLSEEFSESKRAFSPKEGKLLLAVGCAWLLMGIFKDSSLIDPIPLPLTLIAAPVGFGFGAWVSGRIIRRNAGNLVAIIAMPILALLFATFLARTTYEELKFRGAQTTSAMEMAKVLSKDSKWKRSAVVTFGNNTRDISVPINTQLYSSLEPWRKPGRDCLQLRVQTGRDGVRRVISPNLLASPLDLDHYQRCK